MADVTTLGMAVDSSGVRQARGDLAEMTKAGNEAAESATRVEKGFTGQVLAANQLDRAIASTVDTVFNLVRGFIQLGLGVGSYQDIADRTQTNDPAGLASLQTAADVANISVDSVATAINRMQLVLGKVSDESKPAARALASIGIEVEEFKRLDPAEQYRLLATQLDKYADGQSKVAIAQALFGRGGAQQLVMLKELAGETDRSNILTSAQIRYADDLGDSFTRNASKTRQMVAALATGVLPALDGLVTASREAIEEMLGLNNAGADLTNNNNVKTFAEETVASLGFIVDAGDGVVRVFRGIGLTIGAAAAQAAAVATGEFRQAKLIGDEWKRDIAAIVDQSMFSDRLERALAAARARAAAAARATTSDKPAADYHGETNTKLKQQKDVYDEVIATVTKRLEQETMEEVVGRKLTEGEKARIDAYDKLNKAKRALTETENDALETALESIDVNAAANKQREDEIKWTQQATKENASFIDSQQKKLDAAEDLARSAEEELDNYGKTNEQLQRLEVSRLREAAASLRAKKIVDDFNPTARTYNELLDQQADALDRAASARDKLNAAEERRRKDPAEGARRGVEGYLKDIAAVGTETEKVVGQAIGTLENDLTTGLAKGRLDMSATIDYIIQEAMRLYVIRPILQSIFGGGDAGGAGSLLSLFGGSAGFGNLGTLFGGGSSLGGIGFGTGAGFGNLDLGGFFAEGGRPPVGKASVVGEKGPELFIPDQAGTVVPNGAGRGPVSMTYAPVIRIDSRSDQAQIAKIVNNSLEANNQAFIAQLKAAGVV